MVALRSIKKNEELTLDYSQFLDENMEPFHCKCGSANCRGKINGVTGNSVNQREQKTYVYQREVKGYRPIYTISICTSLGLIPDIRLACPSVPGFMRVNFSLASFPSD